MSSLRSLLIGTAAGAVGTAALNVTTYADMATRGRPASEAPGTMVQKVASANGVTALASDDDTAKNRREGVSSLLGYANGLGVGAAYGVLRPIFRGRIPYVLTGLLAGAAVMALSDVPLTRTGATDPKKWGTAGWLADIVPHMMFGLALAASFEALAKE